MRLFRRLVTVALFASSWLAPRHAAALAAPAAKPLNVLFIVSDDLNTRIGCYGDPTALTPNIDRLAARGTRFDRAYCQYPVCNPSRTSFLSGLHTETTHVWTQDLWLKRSMPGVVYLPEHFHNHGYFTAAVGKVEHGGHRDAQWDLFEDFKAGAADDDESDAPKPKARRATGAPKPAKKAAEDLPYTVERQTADDDPELTDIQISRKTVELLEQHRDKPFFLAVGFHKPHVPHVAPKKYFDLFPLDAIRLSEVPRDDERDIPPAALAAKKNYQPDMKDSLKRQIIRAYLASESHMDAELGKVLDAMDRLKLWDSTVVVFLGDHGWGFGEHNWWAKASLFEPSARAPLIVAAPQQSKPGQVSPRVVEFVDLYPTLTDLCALPKPPQSEGKSFSPLLTDPALPWDKPAYTALGPGPRGRSVRTERYRYTEWLEGKQGVELYDYDKDPHEFTSRATDPAYAAVLSEMKRLLYAGPTTRPTK